MPVSVSVPDGPARRGRARGVDIMIRALTAAMGILALVNLYYVNALTQEVKLMIAALGEMTGHFANVAERMDGLTGTIKAMDRSVALMPVVRDQMSELAGRVERMGGDVALMRGTAASMARKVPEKSHCRFSTPPAMPISSRSHCTADPATNTLPSSP